MFIVRKGWDEPIIIKAPITSQEWMEIFQQFQNQVHRYNKNTTGEDTWDVPLRNLLERALGYLEGVARVVFSPFAIGHILPWAVVAWKARWRSADGYALPLTTVPSVGVLTRLRLRKPRPSRGPALVVGNPLGDLDSAQEEAVEVARMLDCQAFLGSKATKGTVMKGLRDAEIIHLATHAFFSSYSPLESGVILFDGVLTVQEIFSLSIETDLLVLSACQTGLYQQVNSGDELGGLASAFLHAGAGAMVCSLWEVDDEATQFLMVTFYNLCSQGMAKPEALCEAMTQTRNHERWSHPYYWGAFAFIGA
jgi:hypothetical protein